MFISGAQRRAWHRVNAESDEETGGGGAGGVQVLLTRVRLEKWQVAGAEI